MTAARSSSEHGISVKVALETKLGEIVVEVYPARAPLSAGAFLRCVDEGHYSQVAFSRSVRAANDRGTPAISVLQAAATDESTARRALPHESTSVTGLRHVSGALSLPRLETGTATPSAFFISIGDQPSLDFGGERNADGEGFAVFGKVVQGMPVVRKIHSLPNRSEAPLPYLEGQMLEEPVPVISAERLLPTECGGAMLKSLSAEFWEFKVREFPLEATFAGDKRMDDRLGYASDADIERRASECTAMLAQALCIDPRSLSEEELITLSLLVDQLTNVVEGFRVGDHKVPKFFPQGFYDVFETVIKIAPLNTMADFEALLARLRATPRYFRENIERIESAANAGYRVPEILLSRLCGVLDAQLSENGILARIAARLQRPPTGMVESDFEPLRRAVLATAAQHLLPELQRFRQFCIGLAEELCCESPSICDQPNGEAIYRFRIKQQTTSDLSPEAIHLQGLNEVAAIQADVSTLLRRLEFSGDGRAFADHLTQSNKFIEEDANALLEKARGVAKRVDGLLPRLFGRLPRITYGVQSFTAEQSLNGPPALAQPAPADRSQAGIFWITALPERCPSYQLLAYSLHEAWPGHLMQFARAHELDHLPEFRRFGWADYNSYIEGWALYCERLGIDLDLYDNPYSAFGRLSLDIWRAVRLVVDTGLHWKRWSRAEAIAYMIENSFLPEDVVAFEVDRYIGWPAQALSYKLGEKAILALREEADERLGAHFSLRSFHDEVLSVGPVSLRALQVHVRNWIAAQETA